jgi:hypothetical protein
MRLTKVHSTGDEVTIKYEVKNDQQETEIRELPAGGAPAPEFTGALQAFGAYVLELCGFTKKWGEEITVRGVTIQYQNDRPRVTVSAVRPLERTNAPLVINTPRCAVPDDDVDEEPTEGPATQLPGLLEALLKETIRYLNGHRQQMDVFEDAA